MPFTSGSTFTGYSVLRPLGRGEMGEVYLAQHPRLPHWNALKVLSATLTEDREFRDRFMRETPIATSLYHPHILGVEYRGESDGQLWITMDYVNGINAAHHCVSPPDSRTGSQPGRVVSSPPRMRIANSRPTTARPTRNHQTSPPGGLLELRAHPSPAWPPEPCSTMPTTQS